MEISILATFWTVSILFIITPGVDWAYAISAGMKGRVVFPAVTGLILGHFAATIVVAAGIGTLVANNPLVLMIITTIGAGYLLWVGINLLKSPPIPSAIAMTESDYWLNWVKKGVCISGLNPKVFLLFLALLPQFTDPSSTWSIPVQIIALGVIHIISCSIVYLMVGYSSKIILQTRPKAAQFVGRTSGVLMIFIALILLVEQIDQLI